MQSDIVPPAGRHDTKTTKNQPRRSLGLRGISLDGARSRLLGAERRGHSYQPTEHTDIETTEVYDVSTSNQPSKRRRWHYWSKRRKIVASFLSLLILVGIGTGTFLIFLKEPAVVEAPLKVQAAPPKPTTVASPLSGLQVTPEAAARPVTGIMIENSISARPQSGLADAGVVFEAIAEGGITRFIALFQDTQPQYVGPVRSLRPYYIDFASSFAASIAHVGGSPDALAQIRSGGKDLDQFFNAGSYWRQSSRPAPHNVYTSFEKLDALNQKKGYTSSQFTLWKRKAEKAVTPPTAAHIDVNISSARYNSRYDYDAATNTYLRSEGGAAHIVTASVEDKTGQQLKPKVVLALVMPYSTSGKYSVYGTSGSGDLYVFQDGAVAQGTWTKADRNSQFILKDPGGAEIALNPGQTWVVALAAANRISYTP